MRSVIRCGLARSSLDIHDDQDQVSITQHPSFSVHGSLSIVQHPWFGIHLLVSSVRHPIFLHPLVTENKGKTLIGAITFQRHTMVTDGEKVVQTRDIYLRAVSRSVTMTISKIQKHTVKCRCVVLFRPRPRPCRDAGSCCHVTDNIRIRLNIIRHCTFSDMDAVCQYIHPYMSGNAAL